MEDPRPNRRPAFARTLRRLLVLGLVIVLVNLSVSWALEELAIVNSPMLGSVLWWTVVASLLLYAVLMAIPFVPGVEIGLSLLMIQGAPVAPFVFLATFVGLSLAFFLGRYLPYTYLHKVFADLGLRKACVLLDRLQPLSQERRLALMRKRLPGWLGPVAVKYRYLTIAIALNTPGNFVLGGGGGIALIAGLSRLFAPWATLLTFALAVSPVAIAVYVLGSDFFFFWKTVR